MPASGPDFASASGQTCQTGIIVSSAQNRCRRAQSIMNPPSPYDLPPLTMAAIFLDMDGTLAPIARRPVDVRVANDMLMLLDLLHTRTEGAIAILTGRPAWQIDDLLAPRLYALAAEHGAGVRMADGKTLTAAARHLDVALLERTVRHALQSIDDIYIERKDHGIAVHYRQAPRQGGLIAEQTTRIAANTEGVEVLNGKMVIELKAVGVNKGLALNTLMAHPPFAGRTPVVFGDDTTD